MIETRPFGRSGHMSTVTLFGAAALGRVSQADADRTLEVLLEYGVNHIDAAPRYGEAELRIGPWMAEHRRKFFLASKTGGAHLSGGPRRDTPFVGAPAGRPDRPLATAFAGAPGRVGHCHGTRRRAGGGGRGA